MVWSEGNVRIYADDRRRLNNILSGGIKRKYRSTRERLSKCEPRPSVRYLIFLFRFTVLVHSIHLCWVVWLPTVRPYTNPHTRTHPMAFICLYFWCDCCRWWCCFLPATEHILICFARLFGCRCARDASWWETFGFQRRMWSNHQRASMSCVFRLRTRQQQQQPKLLQRDDWEPFNVVMCIKQNIWFSFIVHSFRCK